MGNVQLTNTKNLYWHTHNTKFNSLYIFASNVNFGGINEIETVADTSFRTYPLYAERSDIQSLYLTGENTILHCATTRGCINLRNKAGIDILGGYCDILICPNSNDVKIKSISAQAGQLRSSYIGGALGQESNIEYEFSNSFDSTLFTIFFPYSISNASYECVASFRADQLITGERNKVCYIDENNIIKITVKITNKKLTVNATLNGTPITANYGIKLS